MSPKKIQWEDDEQLFATDPLGEAAGDEKEPEEPSTSGVPAATADSRGEPLKAPMPLPPSSALDVPAGTDEEREVSAETQGGRFSWEVEDDAMPAPAGDGGESSVLEDLSEDDAYSDKDFDDGDLDAEEEHAFATLASQKVGIVGGKGVGKSYLFQAMVYRTSAGKKAGALTYYLEKDAVRLFSALQRDSEARTMNLVRFIKNFKSWQRLPPTKLIDQRWYRLRLRYRTGLLGRRRAALEVEFFDGSGEGFFEARKSRANNALWREGYLDARVMVFCLPIWAAFPDSGMSEGDWKERDLALEGFEQVVQNYMDLREQNQREEPVQTILALTMADDRRCALRTLRDRWMAPYMDSPETFLRQLRTGSGVARYVANAQRVSKALHEEFAAVRESTISGIPQKLDFGAGEPWIVPVSAIEGEFLDSLEETYPPGTERPRLAPPVPVHVELPLLVALCDRHNALM